MGSRGAFVSVNTGDFSFVEGGQNYYSIGEIDNVKVLVQKEGAVKAPEYSHTENRIYAIIQKGQLKHIAYYDENHKQVESIDLLHGHGKTKIQPHKHYNFNHNDKGIPITTEQEKLINKIKRRFNLK